MSIDRDQLKTLPYRSRSPGWTDVMPNNSLFSHFCPKNVLLDKYTYNVNKVSFQIVWTYRPRETGYRLRSAAARSCSCAANSFVCLPCSCPASKRGGRVRLLIDAAPQFSRDHHEYIRQSIYSTVGSFFVGHKVEFIECEPLGYVNSTRSCK